MDSATGKNYSNADRDLKTFSTHLRLRSFLSKLGLKSPRRREEVLTTTHIEDAARYAMANFGAPSEIIMSPHSYDTLIKMVKKQ